jgi:hypothetical protein
MFPEYIKVKRTNKSIENDWNLIPYSPTYNISNDIMVIVRNNSKNLEKYVDLYELCYINSIKFDDVYHKLIEELHAFYYK